MHIFNPYSQIPHIVGAIVFKLPDVTSCILEAIRAGVGLSLGLRLTIILLSIAVSQEYESLINTMNTELSGNKQDTADAWHVKRTASKMPCH